MKKLSLVIADRDEEYLKALSNYLSNNHFKEFVITAISDELYLKEFLNTIQGVDILLIGKDFYNNNMSNKFISKIIILGEDKLKESSEYIYKYQIASNIYKKIKNSYIELNPSYESYDDSKDKISKVTTVYSPIGGIGKTSVAISIALKLSEKSRNVLYINFEDISSVETFLECSNRNSMSEMLYLAKDRNKLLRDKILNNILTDSLGICYFSPVNSVLDLENLNRDDIIFFINEIKKLNKFDNIIIDLGSKFNSIYAGILNESDNVIVLMGSDLISKVKMENFLKQQESIDKYIFVLNKYKKQNIIIPESLSKYNKSILSAIDYYYELDGTLCGINKLRESNQFTITINDIVQKIFIE